MKLRSDQQAVRLLEVLFENAPTDSLTQLVVERGDERRAGHHHLAREWPLLKEDLKKVLDFNAKSPGSKVTFGVHPRATAGKASSDVEVFCGLIADVDQKRADAWDALPAKLAALEKAGVPPSIVVNSGHGVHLYWLLKSPELAHGQPSKARATMYRLQKHVGSDAVHDPARILRLPGSVNWKTGKPVPSRVEELHPDRRYTSAQIDAALDRAGIPSWPLPPSILGRGTEGRHTAGARRVSAGARRVSPLGPVGRKPKLPSLATRIESLIKDGYKTSCGYPSRSEADQAVVLALVKAGISDARIEKIFSTYPVGEKYRELGAGGPAYLERAIAASLDFTPAGRERVKVTVRQIYVNHLPERDGMAAALRAHMYMETSTGTEIRERFYVPPDPARPWILPRWEAIWRAAGLKPSKDGDTGPLIGRTMLIEVTSANEVINFLPKSMFR